MKDGRRFGRPPEPFEPPAAPTGKINLSDLDSRNVKTSRGWVQGYNAQAVATEDQIVIAAEVTVASPDFGHLEPMICAARDELRQVGIEQPPDVVLADAGYWHQVQMERLLGDGLTVLIPPDAKKRAGARPGWDGGLYAFMRRVLDDRRRRRALRQTPDDDRADLRRHQVQPPHRPLPTPRQGRRPIRMAPDQRRPQPAQALAAHHRPGGGLTGRRRGAQLGRSSSTPTADASAETPAPRLSATASAQSSTHPAAR